MSDSVLDYAGALGTLLLGIGSFGGLLVALSNRRKADMHSVQLQSVIHNTNGLTQRLEDTAKALGISEGRETQRKEDAP